MSLAPTPTVVLDASALLAYLQSEVGHEVVGPELDGALISSVNWSEVIQKSIGRGVNVGGLRQGLSALGLTIEPFTPDEAERTAHLWQQTRALGLSLGDRVCLALGLRSALPVLTADRAWLTLSVGPIIRATR